MSDPTMDHLIRRLEQLEDEAAIHATLYAYGSALDYGDRDQFLGCFTKDADYYVSLRLDDGTGMEFHGHEQLDAYFDGHTHAPTAWHKHITTNPTVDIDGDTATATSYFIRVDAGDASGPAVVIASGRYLDTFHRDGTRWRIRTRRCEVENL